MSNRYWTDNPDRKLHDTGGGVLPKPGGNADSMPMRTASWPGLPGKASNGFAKFKAGAPEVNGYAMYEGLSSKKWIQKAIKHPGALTKKAHKAGESPMAYAREHAHDSGKTGKQARLAMTLRKMHH